MERITRETIKIGQATWNPSYIPEKPHSVRINGWPWYFRLRADNGLYPADAQIPDSDFVVSWQVPKLPYSDQPFINEKGRHGRVYGKFATSSVFVKFLTSVDPDAIHFFEVVPDNAQRARFDLDMSMSDLYQNAGRRDMSTAGHEAIAQLQQSVSIVLESLGLRVHEDHDFTVCQSHGPEKQSYHLICNGFMHGNHREARAFYEMVIGHIKAVGQEWMVPFIDHSIYSKVSHFRPLFSTKPGHQRWKVIDDTWPITWEPRYESAPPSVKKLIQFNRTCITNVLNATWIPIEVEEVVYSSYEVGDQEVREAMTLLDECMPGHPFKYDKLEDRFVRLFRESPSLCPVCERVHEDENPYIKLGSPPTWYCRRSGKEGFALIKPRPVDLLARAVAALEEATTDYELDQGHETVAALEAARVAVELATTTLEEATRKAATPAPEVTLDSAISKPLPSKSKFMKPRRDLMTDKIRREMIHGKPIDYWQDLQHAG